MSLPTKTSLLQESDNDRVVQFLAELLQATLEVENPAAFQQALQTYCDGLRPWLEPSDGPPNLRAVFSLLENFTMDAAGENITVVISPEAEALFRAWLRRNKIGNDAGLNAAKAWTN